MIGDETWTVLRTGPAHPQPTSRFTEALDRVINLVRTCALDEAASASESIRSEARAECDHEAVGRASSFLGEIAGIRGDLDAAMREFGTAIEHLEHTDLAGSIARAYRGLANCHLISRMPNLALGPALEAQRLAGLIDIPATKDRAEFESSICLGFTYLGLSRLVEAEAAYRAVERLVPAMTLVDAWLPGLFELLGGRLQIERGRLEADNVGFAAGVDRIGCVVRDFENAGLCFWQAFALECLGRAMEDTDLNAAIRHMMGAARIYGRIGASRLFDAATQWIEAAKPATGTRYSPAQVMPRPRELPMEVSVVSGQLVAGPKTRLVFERAMRYAELDHPVLILGESGTGKEGLARIIHEASARSGGPFVPINCASVPENLLESMLFGHKKGSFTGASDHQTGLVKSAHGGTLFLDEIGELPEALQPKLLRFLETRKMLRLGDTSEQAVDVRVVAATNRRLEDAVRESRFREDLYYRLNVLRLESLPLRLRMEEVPSLAQFVAEAEGARLTVGALTLLTIHDWPGNVRQLRNVVSRARAEVGAGATVITRSMVAQAMASDLGCAIAEFAPPHLQTAALGPQFVRLDSPDSVPGRVPNDDGIPVVARDYPFMRADGSLHPGMVLGDAEREFQIWQMARALERCDNAKSRTARYLGMNLQTFLVRARKHGLIKEAAPAAGGKKSPDSNSKSKRRPKNSE